MLALVNKHGDMSKLIREYKLGAVFLYTEIDEITAWIASQFEDYKAGTVAPLAMPDQSFFRENKPKTTFVTQSTAKLMGSLPNKPR